MSGVNGNGGREIVFILEPDAGRVTVETSRIETKIAKEIERDLGQGSVLNCARPSAAFENRAADKKAEISSFDSEDKRLYLFRLYHNSTVGGFGRGRVGSSLSRKLIFCSPVRFC